MQVKMDGGRRRRLWGSVGRDLCEAGKRGRLMPEEGAGAEFQTFLESSPGETFSSGWSQGESFLLGNTGLLYLGEVGSPRDKKGSTFEFWKAEKRDATPRDFGVTATSVDAAQTQAVNSLGGGVYNWDTWNSRADIEYGGVLMRVPEIRKDSHGGGAGLEKWLTGGNGLVGEEGGKSHRVERNWADMPLDILAVVFSHLPVEQRLLTVPLVCRGWLDAARLSSCFADVDVDEWSQGFTMYATLDFFEGPQRLCRHVQDGLVGRVAALGGAGLRSLRARQCTGDALAAIGQHCAMLERLELPDLRGAFDDALRPVIGRLPHLRALALQPLLVQQAREHPVLSSATLEELAHSCGGLRQLDLTECRGLQRSGLLAVAEGCPQLQSLNLDSCLAGSEAAAVMQGLAAHCRGLTHLNVADCGLEADGLAAIAALTNLRDLTLRCNYFPHTLPRVVGAWRHLRQLDVGDNPWLDDRDLEAVARACPRLGLLDVSNCAVTDIGFAALARHCRGLRELHADYDMVTDAGLRQLAAGCSALRLLSLKNTGLTDAALAILAGACPDLTRLTVAGHRTRARPNGLTREGLARLVATCPKICGLGLSLVDLGPATADPTSLALGGGDGAIFADRRVGFLSPQPGMPLRSVPPGPARALWESDPNRLPADMGERSRGSTAAGGAPAAASMTQLATIGGSAVLGVPAAEEGEGGARTEGPVEEVPAVRFVGGMLATLALLGRGLVDVRLDGPDREIFVDLNEALVEFVRCCPNLRMLDLNYFRNLTDATAGAVAALSPGLEQLGFGWCDLLSNAALAVVAASCRRLRILEICCCPRVTGEAFETLGRMRPGTQVLSGHNVVFRVLRDPQGGALD